MTQEVLTKCGYRCDLCLAYIKNVERQDQRTSLSDGWYDIYGFRIEPEDIYCEGCVSSENPVLVDKNCPVRPCVISKSIENCSGCDDYICDKLKGRIVDKKNLEEKIKRILSAYEYENFVFPYESKARLDRLRKNKI
jgi:hypothetical protein